MSNDIADRVGLAEPGYWVVQPGGTDDREGYLRTAGDRWTIQVSGAHLTDWMDAPSQRDALGRFFQASTLLYRDHAIRPDLVPIPDEDSISDDWAACSDRSRTGVRTLLSQGLLAVLVWQPGAWDVVAFSDRGIEHYTWREEHIPLRLLSLLAD